MRSMTGPLIESIITIIKLCWCVCLYTEQAFHQKKFMRVYSTSHLGVGVGGCSTPNFSYNIQLNIVI